MKLVGKVAVVTGGGTGIGRACSVGLAREGAAVVVNYSRRQVEAEDTVQSIVEAGGKAIAVRADVSQDVEARMLIAQAVETFGRLDILVNNAGWTKRTPHAELEKLTEEILDHTLSVNVKGPLYCTRAAVPTMQAQGAGYVVNITSVAGFMGIGSSIIYAGSKAALAAMTKSLARALAPQIRVNAVAPVFVDTGFADWPPEALAQSISESHIGRLVTPEDVAGAVIYLVTDGTALTGEEILVDAGIVTLGVRR